jgi:raffinose/stachyose/melibiose transport system substrate-binding protein
VEIWSWRTQDAQVWQEVQKNLKAKGEDITIDFHDVMYRGWITPKNITS